MSFVIYDLIFFALFCILVGIFLLKNKKNLKRESKVFLLYRTKTGIKAINWFSKKFSWLLDILSPVSITYGFVAMFAMIYLLIQSIILMFNSTIITKAPPLMPLIPYMPQMFDLPLPPFYFTTWLIVIAVIAIVHEFAHGVYATRYGIKIKSTGFGFLGPFLAAFVEPDEKSMARKSKKKQMTIISAGSFSNFIFAIIFILLLQLFFVGFYEKAGVDGYVYSLEKLNISDIDKIGPYSYSEFMQFNQTEMTDFVDGYNILVFTKNSKQYMLNDQTVFQFSSIKENKTTSIILFNDAPAIRANLSGPIQSINGVSVNSIEDLNKELSSFKPLEIIQIKTLDKNYSIQLSENPVNSSDKKGFLGIGFVKLTKTQMFFSSVASPFLSPFSYAKEKIPGSKDILLFTREIFFWLIIVLISVSLMNMLPLGILDGGRFIFLTFFGLTKSKKIAEKIYGFLSMLILLIFLGLMIVWVFRL